MKKQYIIRKYVMAENARAALRIEKNIKADECWIDDDWKKQQSHLAAPVGFRKK